MKPFYESPTVTIYNARWEDVWPTLGLAPKDVALCWADPPYGTQDVYIKGGSNSRRDNTKYRPVAGDSGPYDPRPLLNMGLRRLVLWGANYYADLLPPSSSWWTWDKKGQDWDCNAGDAELAWTNLGGVVRTARYPWLGGHRSKAQGFLHPTQKPVALCEWGFERAGLKPGDLVFSPYLGSGPEVRAALNLGLRIIGCEVDAAYCQTVVDHRVALAAPKRGQEGQALLPL